MLELNNVEVLYSDVILAVKGITAKVPAGQCVTLLGANGAGKSTLLGALGGAIPRFEGRIERDPALRIAYLPQASDLDRAFPVRVHEMVALGLWSRTGSLRGLRADVVLAHCSVAPWSSWSMTWVMFPSPSRTGMRLRGA